MDRKNIIIISSSIIAVILILTAGWYFFFKAEPVEPPAGELPVGELPSGGGGGGAGGSGSAGGVKPTGGELPVGEGAMLYQLVGSATSGNSFVATTTMVRYFDKSTGNLYETKIDGSETKRLSNSTILRSFDVAWSPNADRFVVKYMEPNDYGADGIKLFSAQISTSTPSLEGEFLPSGIFSITSSPYEEKLFYLSQGPQGIIGIVSDFSNKNKKQIFNFDFSEFILSWPNKNTISLNTKASGEAEGFLYSINAQTGALSRILGNIKGLTSLISPSGEYVLYSQNEGRALRTKVKLLKSNEAISLDQQTLPEKCVWSAKETSIIYCAVPKNLPNQIYPDAWYQGLITLSDAIWKINLANNTSEMLIETDLDITNMQNDAENKYLIFTNKKDLSLWALRLAEQKNVE